MARIAAVMKKEKAHLQPDGTYPLFLRINSSGTTSFKALQIRVTPDHWIAAEGMVSKKNLRYREYNDIISVRLKEAEDSVLELMKTGTRITAADIKAKAELASYSDFKSFAEQHNNRYEGFYTYKGKKSALAKLLEFEPAITWQHFNPTFFRNYIAHLKSQDLREITIHSKFKYYKQLVNEARESGVFQFERSPFAGIKLSAKSAPKPALTMDELNAFRAVQCVGWMRKAQGVFLLQYNLLGMRIGDLLTLKADQVRDGKVYNVTNKDNDYFEIEITEEAQRILNELCEPGTPYLLPFVTEIKDRRKIGGQVSSANADINDHLKHVALRAGIEKSVSTHMARRTWAQGIYQISKDVRLVQRGLGHSSSTTTEGNYLQATSFDELNKANKKLAGG